VVYVDPYLIDDTPHDADLILITHAHDDHYSPKDIARVMKEDTCFASTADVWRRLEEDFNIDPDYFTTMGAGTPSVAFECGVVVTPLAAENVNHPVGMGFGFVLELDEMSYYVSGDTDVLDDTARCDVLFVCCDGIWNMPGFETRVVEQVQAMAHRPGIVIPYHYGEDGVPEENGALLCKALSAAGIPCKEMRK
jgi:L-ascorbate metabolism protein UlaG (beta-lactamase superfamily)